MKSTNTIVAIAVALLCLFAFGSASFAATNPLNFPMGLAVDAKGNLWVANSGDNNILVFSPGYALQKADTITQGVSSPTGVAFDPQGNLWVTNFTASSVTEYTSRVQNTSNTITFGIQNPEAIAIDGLGDIWVENGYLNVTVYGSSFPYAPATSPVTTIDPGSPVYGIAIGAGTFSFGGDIVVSFVPVLQALTGNIGVVVVAPNNNGFALASDVYGNVYMGNFDGSVRINVPIPGGGTITEPFLQLPFTASGIAVDSVRNRVYISDAGNSQIQVYSTAGVLLKTIQ
ncbi:MAG: hypothetical protein ABSD75_26515 [Terriglobales bacterium]|jgi:sugar lactone lactonase YvrE